MDAQKSYLWIGCNKKFLRIKPGQVKSVKFRLAVFSSGVYEIGAVESKSTVMENASNTSLNNVSIDELDGDSSSLSLGNNFGESYSGVLVFSKSASSGRYELFKRLNSFALCVLNS